MNPLLKPIGVTQIGDTVLEDYARCELQIQRRGGFISLIVAKLMEASFDGLTELINLVNDRDARRTLGVNSAYDVILDFSYLSHEQLSKFMSNLRNIRTTSIFSYVRLHVVISESEAMKGGLVALTETIINELQAAYGVYLEGVRICFSLTEATEGIEEEMSL